MNPAAERRQRPSPGSGNPVEAPAPRDFLPRGANSPPLWDGAVMDGLCAQVRPAAACDVKPRILAGRRLGIHHHSGVVK